ncbi:hypothetical protein UK23_35330 [Lentzea aerocolonigenes]|uniref:Uncharacterized protein n=1 Tax=Lentzea aerocolonigenes TaxID=68170 RepID=A0A0F0GN56_LENAE|nr:hypothetical protein [Lentzea aerocolonigenes]KJK42863.1 hypothetical protein UK23_35330 [Lentzea aerocolonigenes]
MPFDPATIITSAVVGGFAGLVFATWKTGREETAKRRMLAQDRVQEAVGEMLADVIAYQAGLGGGRDHETGYFILNYQWASAVVIAARGLGPVRQHLVNIRLRYLVGELAYSVASAKPATSGQETMGTAIAAMFQANREGTFTPRQLTGLLDIALKDEPKSKSVKKLRRQLRRLSKSW